MKNIITAILITISVITYSQEKTYSFNTEITGFRNFEGKVMIQIFDKDQEVIKVLYGEFENEKCVFKVDSLPKGEYAIRYFHDENSDNQLGLKFGMIPNEGFGYSNNAKAYFGEPDFNDWLFLLDENKSLHLKVNYLF